MRSTWLKIALGFGLLAQVVGGIGSVRSRLVGAGHFIATTVEHELPPGMNSVTAPAAARGWAWGGWYPLWSRRVKISHLQ